MNNVVDLNKCRDHQAIVRRLSHISLLLDEAYDEIVDYIRDTGAAKAHAAEIDDEDFDPDHSCPECVGDRVNSAMLHVCTLVEFASVYLDAQINKLTAHEG